MGDALSRGGEGRCQGKLVAAHLLEAAVSDTDFVDGCFVVTGTDRRLSFASVAGPHMSRTIFRSRPPSRGLRSQAAYDPPSFAFSNGAHVCEIEIDPQTGRSEIVGYWAVDDVAAVINPMIVHGQVHGGVCRGVGQALLERCAYDGNGQLVTGSFMDYGLARADDLPPFIAECDESQPCTHNPLGAKGCGEAGAIAAPAAVVSAALDALAPLGVTDLDMPLTSEQIWRRISRTEAASPSHSLLGRADDDRVNRRTWRERYRKCGQASPPAVEAI